MPTYLYCLVSPRRETPRATLHGLDDQPVRCVRAGAVAVWISDIDHAAPQPTVARAQAHDDVVRCALERETPLPARFGQVFASDAAVVESVRVRSAAYARVLARVRGAVEMTVRLLPTRPAPPVSPVVTDGMRGRDYLAVLRDQQAAERAWQEEANFLQRQVANAVHGVVRAEVRPVPPRSARSVVLSHLVELDRVPTYRSALRAVAASRATPRLVVSGPWAPYSFAEVERG